MKPRSFSRIVRGSQILSFFTARACPVFLLRPRFAALLSIMIVLHACTTLQLPEYQAKPLARYPSSLSKDGLSVAIHPLTDGEENEKYFGTDLVSNGILLVFVIARNEGSSSFILKKDQFSLGNIDRLTESTSDRERFGSESGGKGVLLVGALLISLPLQFLGGKMISNATIIKQNFLVKELQTETLSPGKTTQGFVYFRLPEERVSQNQWHIHLEAVDLKTKETEPFNLSFQWDRR